MLLRCVESAGGLIGAKRTLTANDSGFSSDGGSLFYSLSIVFSVSVALMCRGLARYL